MRAVCRSGLRNAGLVTLCLVVATTFWSGTVHQSGAEPPPPGEEISLSLEDEGTSIQLAEGQVLSIVLPANPTTGYTWEVAQPAATAESGQILRPLIQVDFLPESDFLGAPGLQTLRFEQLSEGVTTLHLVYHRPWEVDAPPARTFSAQVRTAGPSDGTTPVSAAPPQETMAEETAAIDVGSGLGLPTAYNWCSLGGCTPVKDQEQCGSCWAFATVGVLESNILIHDAVARDLSEQYLVSCNTDGWGCDGGLEAHDYHWWKTPPCESTAGSVYETDFPYVGWDSPCNPPHQHRQKIGLWGFVENWWSVPSASDLKQAIYDHGPVAAEVCAGPGWDYYTGGVFNTNESWYCPGETNHVVVLVGWDDNQGTNGVWFVRNSWGPAWGESGYMRMAYGISNLGQAASYVVYPPSSVEPAAYLPLAMKAPSAPLEGWVPIVTENFEGPYLGCWVVEDNQPGYGEYYWGKRDCLAAGGEYSGWAVGGGSDGRSLLCGSKYPNNTYTWMVYGPFSLADATAAELRFRLWLNTEIDYDAACGGASVDGLNFYSYCTSGYSDGWVQRSLDLSDAGPLGDLTGRSSVWVALIFESDYTVNYPAGAYVDDVVLRKYVSTTSAPPSDLAAHEGLPQGAQVSEFETLLVLGQPFAGKERGVSPSGGAK